MSRKDFVLAGLCGLLTLAAGISIYFTQFAKRLPMQSLHVGVGRAMAQEAAKLLEGKGNIVVLEMEKEKAPELKVQLQEFDASLKKLGNFAVRYKTLETEDQAKYRTGAGLSARRFLRALKNYQDADLVVSFVGAPRISDEDLKAAGELKKVPKFMAEVRAAEKLKPLFQQKLIQAAVVSRFEFPAPGPEKPRTPEEWFQNRFQVVTPQNSDALP